MYVKRLFHFLLLWTGLCICRGNFFISKYNDSNIYYCVTNTSFAMEWILPTIQEPIQTVIRYLPKSERPVLKTPWIFKNSIRENFNHLILDERWEEITSILYDGMKPFRNLLTDLTGDFTIPLSIRTERECHILLCDGSHPAYSNCYWFMLQVSLGTENVEKTAIRKCKRRLMNYETSEYHTIEPCTTPKTRKNISKDQRYFSQAKWTHFEIGKKGNRLFFNQFVNSSFKNIIEWLDDEGVFNVSQMLILGKKSRGLWKIHQVNYTQIDKACDTNLGKFRKNKDNSVCVSMYIAMCENCTIKLTATGSNQPDQKSYTYKQGWTQIKYIVDNVKNDELTITLSTIGNAENKFWAIDNVRSCHKEEYRIIETNKNASCQLMSKDKNVASVTSNTKISDSNCPETTIGDFCVPCDLLYKTSCKGLQVCTTENCVCSAGYLPIHDGTCLKDCPANRYGHGCRKTCGTNCHNCNNIDGQCEYCSNNYRGYLCEDKLPGIFVKYPPEVVNVSHTQVKNFEIHNGEDNEYPETYEIKYQISTTTSPKPISSQSPKPSTLAVDTSFPDLVTPVEAVQEPSTSEEISVQTLTVLEEIRDELKKLTEAVLQVANAIINKSIN